MNAIERAVATFEPISLGGANHVAELQTRVDRKYLVDESALWELLDSLAPTVRVLEIDGRHSCHYQSTYFDTDNFALNSAAVQGRRKRFKVRSRTYGDDGPCFLEVKAKGSRGANVKSRIGYCRIDHDTITGNGLHFVEEVTGNSNLASFLLPALTTQYTRSTLIDPGNHTRLTFDRHVRCTDHGGTEAVLDAIVVETKSARAARSTDQWLWRHGVRPTKISKFCTGLAAIRPELPANKWHRMIDRHWRIQPSSPSPQLCDERLQSCSTFVEQ
ncbi:MAG: hypothetical protein ACJAXA_003428 [Candidatus Aldehydirespiratoraceae bacterium]|jgi:hypothetical protein